MRMHRAAMILALCLGPAACAQSLFLRMVEEPATPGPGASSAWRACTSSPPEPRTFRRHDIVYVIVNESSRASSNQKLETAKESTVEDRLNAIIDPIELLQLRLRASSVRNLRLLDLDTEREFTGEGKYNRNDQLSARIAAEVIDVKPNGNIVLQARKAIGTDGERKVMVLSGLARQEDVTDANTILSSQLADLRIDVQHEGDLRKSSEKGLFTRVLDTLFNF